MKNILKFATLVFMFILFACSFSSDVDLIVANNTNSNLQLIYSFDGFTDTSSISAGTKLIVVNIGDNSSTTEGRLDDLELIPLDILEIFDENGLEYNKEILDITNWEKIYPEHNGGEGKVMLKLVDSDFE